MFIGPLETPELLMIPCHRLVDSRGYFCESFSRRAVTDFGVTCDFVQDNEALSIEAGTLRGLHFQVAPCAQAKLIRVISGAIFDVVVDLRMNSPSFGKWRGCTLTGTCAEMLFVPAGFAHAYVTLEPNTLTSYKVDSPYSRSAEAGIRWDDPDIGIDWPWSRGKIKISDRDAKLPYLQEIKEPFRF